MSVLGFVETILSNLGESQGSVAKLLPESREYIIIYSSLLLLFCTVVCLIGTRFVTRATMILALILLVSTLSIMFSLGLRQPFENVALSIKFRGWNLDTLSANMWPELADGIDLKQLFAIVFPACTGILTGGKVAKEIFKLALFSPSSSQPLPPRKQSFNVWRFEESF